MNDTCKKWGYSRIRDWNLKRKVKNCKMASKVLYEQKLSLEK